MTKTETGLFSCLVDSANMVKIMPFLKPVGKSARADSGFLFWLQNNRFSSQNLGKTTLYLSLASHLWFLLRD